MKQKLLVISNNYPSESGFYANVFIHSRVIHYTKELDVQVLIHNSNKREESYVYENVPVQVTNDKKRFSNFVESFSPDVIAIHFVESWMFKSFIKTSACPIYIWVHGAEALGWYRRLFNITSLKGLLSYIKNNTIQLAGLRRIICHANRAENIKFIFVSNWMKRITEYDTLSRVKQAVIIPNPIDVELFKYTPKEENQRRRILLIRPFASRKYANDLAINSIRELSKRPIFADLEISLYGEGRFFTPLTDKIKDLPNVTVTNSFIEHAKVPNIHQQYGIFLCPTRQDAQGVSMCEAMASGLVVVTSDNTAIPEFVEDNKTGLLTHSPKEIADKIEYLYYHPELFCEISRRASERIREISGHENVIRKEISLLTGHTS